MAEIRLAVTPPDRLAVFRLRYAIYIEEMGRPLKKVNHADKVLVDSLDVPEAILLAAWHEGQIVGTARTNYLRNCDIGEYDEFYDLSALSASDRAVTSISTRIMVRPDFRRTTLAAHLASGLYRQALADGILADFCDCNEHLLPFFGGLGYRIHRADVRHAEYGCVTVLRLDMTDLNHLAAVRSPFRKVLRERGMQLVAADQQGN